MDGGAACPLSPEQYERAGQGWSTFFDRIAERLSRPD
jgi:hypothetical protein